ncbi:MAG: GNAT family N-acetyltransferase [Phaeodactylibacter sp.]|nr:GNAT family N-acetyltransferase [Phaeodactylibacter sp.]
MPTPPSIHLLRSGDEALLLRLAERFYESSLPVERTRELLKREGHFLLCLREGDALIGFCYFHILPQWYSGKDELFLYDIEVVEARRRQGYGRQLFGEVFQFAKERDIATVWLMVERSNMGAQEFYKAMGGEVQGEEGMVVAFGF